MYEPHPSFHTPSNAEISIWRYMDFTKFVGILASSSLFFSRADLLGDPFEGSYTAKTLELIDIEYRKYSVTGMLSEGARHIRSEYRKHVGVSCWHMNEHESAAMWSLYLKSSEGIAILSSYNKLRDSFEFEGPVYIGEVDYIDYSTEAFDIGNAFIPLLIKRKSFEHEREVRAVVSIASSVENNVLGRNVKVDLNKLVEAIYLSPTSPNWFFDVVATTVEKFGYKFEMRRSGLADGPLF